MPDKPLTAKEIEAKYGITRAQLLHMENTGKIHPSRTTGGQRRYVAGDIEEVTSSPPNIPINPNFEELGVSGFRRWGNVDYQEKIQELRGRAGRRLYREMRDNDPVIGAVFYAIETSLRQATWRVKAASEKSEDKQAADFVDSCFEDQDYTWNDTLSFALEMLVEGFSVLEVIMKRRLGQNPPPYMPNAAPSKYNDGRVAWRKWAPRPGLSLLDMYEFIFDDAGGIHGINQQDPATGQIRKIPIERCLLFRTTPSPADTPYGRSILRSMYLPYFYKKNLQEIEGIGVERDLGGIPVIYMGTGCTNKDFDLAKDLVTNLRADEQAGVVIPYPKMGTGSEGQGMLLELLSAQSTRAHDVSAIIQRYDTRMALAVLAEFILLGTGATRGSYALSKTQGDLWAMSIGAWLQIIAEVVNRFAIPRLFRYNAFPGITGYPKLVPSDVGLQDLAGISTFINNLVGRDVIHPDAELERHLRQMARLPDMPAATVATIPSPTSQKIKDTSALLSRVVGALQIMQRAGAGGTDEVAGMIGPLVEEMQSAIGTDNLALPLEPPPPPEPFGGKPAKPANENVNGNIKKVIA